MTRPAYLRPAIPLVMAVATGILLGGALPGGRVPAGCTAVLCLIWLVRDAARRVPARFGPLFLFAALGYLSIQPWVSPEFPADHVFHAAGRSYDIIEGRILSPPEIRGSRVSFVLAAASLGPGATGDTRKARGRIRVGCGRAGAPVLRQGDAVRFSGSLRRIRGAVNPGGFDYERFMAFQKIWCSAYARKGSLEVLPRPGDSEPPRRAAAAPLRTPGRAISRHDGWGMSWAGARVGIRDRIFAASPGDAGAILSALVIGDKDDISPVLRDRFNRAGIGHLLAISGLHVGSIMALAYGGFRWLLAFVTPLLWHGWLRRISATAALVPVAAYAALAQWPPSTQRAVGMAAAVCLAFWVEREHDVPNAVALAALGILVIFPPALFSISFQFSFAAVAAIVWGTRAILPRPAAGDKWPGRLRRQALSAVVVSGLAILGTLPLSMLYFSQVSFIGILANLVYIPLIGGLVLPLGLGAAAVSFVSTTLADVGFAASGAVLEAGLWVLPVFSELPFGSFRTVVPTLFEVGLYYALLCGLLAVLASRSSNGAGWMPARRKAVLLGGVLLAAAAGDALYWTHDRFFRDDLRVTIIDVGQGSSALIEFPGSYRMLVDGGGYYDRSVFDVGERLVAPFLRRRKILTLDAVVLSHPDGDHLNGLLSILETFRVRQLWTNGASPAADNFRTFVSIVEERKIPMAGGEALPRSQAIGVAVVDILYPPPGHRQEDAARSHLEPWRRKSNNRSLVLSVRLGESGILLPGDIEREAEEDLVKRCGEKLRHRVLVAPHHGSRTSSSSVFLEAVSPAHVLVSAGRGNRFRCPHPTVVERCRALGARMMRTDIVGAIHLATDGEDLVVRPAGGGFR